MNSETMQSKSVWDVMMNISNMKRNGGILITNGDYRIEVIKARIENNIVSYLREDGGEGNIPLLSIKEARPLTIDHELPTRRDEEPIDDRDNDKEFTPEFCIELQGEDIMDSRLSSRKDYRSYDVELPTRRDEEPIDDRDNDKEFISKIHRKITGGDIIESRMLKEYSSYYFKIPPPSKLKRSQACYDSLSKKRKLEEDEVKTPILSYSENALLEFPELRPSFLEPLPVSPRNIKVNESKIEEVEMIPKTEYNKLEDDFARLLKLMFNNNYSILQDAYENGYKVKIRDATAEQRVYSVMYTFENKEELFAVFTDDKGKTLHMNVQDIITVIPSIESGKKYLDKVLSNLKIKPFYEGEPISINNKDYWNFKKININGEDALVHQDTGIVVTINGDNVMFEAVLDEKKYTYEQIYKIKEWVRRCGIYDYPVTPKKTKEIAPPMAPRKEKPVLTYAPECARKLDFSVEESPLRKDPSYLELIVRAIKELKQRGGCSRPLLKEYIRRNFKGDTNSEIFDRAIRQALKKGVEEGYLVQNKQSFKLGDKAKEQKIEKVKEEGCSLLKECKDKHIQITYEGKDRIVIPRSFPEGKRYIVAECMKDKIQKRFIVDKISNIVPGDKLNWRVYGVEAIGVKEEKTSDDEKQKTDVKNALREAYKNNKSIFIKYAKGSIPNVKRPIRILGFQNDLVIAECLIEDSIRNFKIEHIEIVD
jgi:hypothetical protein